MYRSDLRGLQRERRALIGRTGGWWKRYQSFFFFYLPSATKTSSNCSASVTLVHLMRMWSGSVFSGSWWNLHGSVMEPPRCVTTLPGAVCTITAPVSSSAEGRRRSVGFSLVDPLIRTINCSTFREKFLY